jgi:hypothetical protein
MFLPDRAGCASRRPVPHRTRLTFAIALSIAALTAVCGPADAGKAAAREVAKAAEVDTEHLFGFTEGSDIGETGERELESDTTFRSGKNSGAFNTTASEVEFKYTAFENFRISAAATLAYYDIGGVADMDDRRQGSLQSLSLNARYRVLNRDSAPFGMTVSFEPHWGFADETSGVPIRHFGWEGDLLFDRALVPGVLFGAMNVHMDTDRAETTGGGGAEQQPTLGLFVALAGQAMPGVWIGGEARYLRAYEGAGLQIFTGQALYLGPTLYAKLGEKMWLSAAFDVQARGRAVDTPGALDLVNFERYQANFRLGFEF